MQEVKVKQEEWFQRLAECKIFLQGHTGWKDRRGGTVILKHESRQE